MRHGLASATVMALLLVVGGCGSDEQPAETVTEPPTAATSSPTTTGGQGAAMPSGMPLVEGLPVIEATGPPEAGAGEVPLFSWEPVPGAARYGLAVLGPDGPLWSWIGEETEIYLGGLPFERPPGWSGPVIEAGTCWSVIAQDAEGRVIAVSEFLPVSPGDATGHVCVPGASAQHG